MVIFAVLTVFWLFLTNDTLYQSSKQSNPLVHQSSQVYQDCTNIVPTMYQSSKTVKNSQETVKTAQKWPLVYQSSHVYTCHVRVRRIHKPAQTPLPCKTSHHTCLSSGHSPSPVHASGSRSLPCTATLSSTYWWSINQSINQKRIRVTIVTNVTARPLVYSVNNRHQIFHIFGPHSQTFCSPARTP